MEIRYHRKLKYVIIFVYHYSVGYQLRCSLIFLKNFLEPRLRNFRKLSVPGGGTKTGVQMGVPEKFVSMVRVFVDRHFDGANSLVRSHINQRAIQSQILHFK